ncbi:hypothetical protein PTW37_08945 [Arthrobacter agilis]|uniref:hypothetical protein n=1 Tax=Arthrobacter agilis TaxID=37921 RepID=UPI002366AA1E|nr:hypothetical protein [Arthrobacter agilis]WDF32018.1 hypothetical protein PTW37_08945 [Arthrobacter agilis]
MHIKQIATATALLTMLITVSSCGGAEYGIAALEREATDADRLPDVVVDESVDFDSVRKVAEQDRVAYFIGEMRDRRGYCAYAVADADFIGGCGSGAGQLVTVTPGGGSELPQLTLVMDSYAVDLTSDNWTEVHPNILIR